MSRRGRIEHEIVVHSRTLTFHHELARVIELVEFSRKFDYDDIDDLRQIQRDMSVALFLQDNDLTFEELLTDDHWQTMFVISYPEVADIVSTCEQAMIRMIERKRLRQGHQ